jgi:YD repeat-containing protein
MKNILILSAIVIIATAFHTQISRESYRIKSAAHYPDAETFEYVYNSEGHITSVKSTKGNNASYEYFNDKILRRYYDVTKGLSFVDTLALNRNGLVVSITSNNPTTITEKRDFNQDNYLSQTTLYDKMGKMSGALVYEYQNGNLASYTMTDASGNKMSTNTYSYYTDRDNTTGDDNIGEGFVGSIAKNPVKSAMCQLLNLAPVYYKYNYHYDNNGRIKIMVGHKNSGELTDSIVYTYYENLQ